MAPADPALPLEVADEARRVQLDVLRRMTPEQKLRVMAQLRQAAWELKATGIRSGHPELTESEVQARVRQVFWHAAS